MSYKCKECNDKSYKPINGLDKKIPNTHQLCSENVNEFALLIRKGVYPYEYMNSWEKINEAAILSKEIFYSKLNNEGITDEDYALVQKVWDIFQIRNLGEYHDLYVQNDALLIADLFENFSDKCIDIYELDPPHSVSAIGLA